MDLVEVLIADLPNDVINDFKQKTTEILSLIEQNQDIWEKSTQKVLDKMNTLMDEQISILHTIGDNNNGSYIFVPDTNALLLNPYLENWDFSEIDKFEILLLPTVLSELDKLKVNHRNIEVRDKATKLIKKIKEFRRRGRLTDGVPLVKPKSNIRALATEPSFLNTLSWLDIHNNDDRILVSFIEVIKGHPNSSVVLVTNDINLQNKAEYARLKFIEPPK